jgi:predicted Zn-dependent peptidase
MARFSITLVRALAPALVAVLAGPAALAATKPSAFHMPVPLVRTLPNGLRVAVFPDPRLPLVQMHLLLPGGVARESAETPGAASAAAQLLRAGTSSRTAAEFAAEVDRLGGGINGVAGRDYSTVDGTFLSADFEAGLELMADAVVNPIFPVEEVERYQAAATARVRQLRQDPTALAEESLWALAFGAHPYGRRMLGSLEALSRLDRDAVQAFHRDYYRPDGASLAIAGDVDPERACARPTAGFVTGGGGAAARPRAAAPEPPAVRIGIVDYPGQAHSVVRVGLVAPSRDSPDVLPLQLANYILGGAGSSSRIARSLRGGGGLSYDASSGYTILRDAGLVSLGTVARNDSVAIIIRRLRGELARLAEQPPGEAELAAARRYFQSSYPLQFQTPGALTSQWAALDFYGLGPDALDRYVESAGAVTAAQVREAAGRWLAPAHMIAAVAGSASVLEESLRALGPVEITSAEAAAPAAAAPGPPPATPEQEKRGRELLSRAVVAHGGLERLRRVVDSTVNGDMIITLGGNEVTLSMQQVRKDPLRMRFATRLASAENGQILDGARGWIYANVMDSLRVADADSLSLEAMRQVFNSDIVHLLLRAAEPTTQVAWRGSGQAGGREADLVEITIPAAPGGGAAERRLLYLDSANHRLVAEDTSPSATKPGSYDVRRLYGDHRPIAGVLWPFHEERLVGGSRTMTIMVLSVEVNTGVPDGAFQRPVSPEKYPRR